MDSMVRTFFTEVHKLLIEGASRVEIFSYKPENFERESLGGLYIIGELEVAGRAETNDLFILNSLASVIKREYYATPHDNPAINLEEALKAANAAFAHLAQPSAPVKIDVVVAVLSGNALHFTRVGNAQVFLIRNNAWLNLTRATSNTKNASPKKRRLFTNITSGRVQNDDSIILATPKLTPFLQQERFRKRLASAPLEESISFIEKQVTRIRDDISIGLLQLDIHESNPLRGHLEKKNFEPVLKRPPAEQMTLNAEENQQASPAPQEPSSKLIPSLPVKPKDWLRLPLGFLASVPTRLSRIRLPLPKRTQITKQAAPILAKTRLGSLVRPKKFSKRTIFGGALSIIVFIILINLGLNAYHQHQQAQELAKLKASFEQKISDITTGNTPLSLNVWQELDSIIVQISALPNSQTLASDLKAEERATRNRLVASTNSPGLTPIINRSDLGVQSQLQGILLASTNQFIAYDGRSLARVSPANPTPHFSFFPQIIDAVLGLTDPDQPGNTVYIINTARFTQSFTFDGASGAFSQFSLLRPYKTINIVDGAFYNGKIYLLDAAQPQVLRYDPSHPTLQPTLWLNPSAAPSIKPTAIAIDGTIYIAQSPNDQGLSVDQYSGGKKINTITLPPTEVGTISKLATGKNYSALYALDGNKGSILVIDKKTGTIQQRFTNEALLHGTDMILKDSRTLYVLTDLGVVRVILPNQP